MGNEFKEDVIMGGGGRFETSMYVLFDVSNKWFPV